MTTTRSTARPLRWRRPWSARQGSRSPTWRSSRGSSRRRSPATSSARTAGSPWSSPSSSTPDRTKLLGRLHHTVLEVVRYDPATGEAVVLSGFGNESDWLRNLRAGSDIVVSIGRSSSPATYRMLPADEAIDVFADYERRNIMVRPVVRAVLGRLLGWRFD